MAGLDELDESMFAPLFVAAVHGFGDSVREKHGQVSRFKRKSFLLIAKLQDPNDRTARFEARNFPTRSRFAQNQRWIVARVDIRKLAALRIVLGVEESGVAVRRGRLVDQSIDLLHQLVQVTANRGLGSQ